MFVDGALGSRGALLKNDYEDQLNHRGVQISSLKEMQDLSNLCIQLNYQLNAHCIGDSANALVLNLYQQVYEVKKDHRWRIEHAQVIDPKDFLLFAKYAVFPSVQPIHAIDDSQWAEKRLGKKRLIGAYAYRSLLDQFGMLALGTDFPIASLNPFLTLFAANQRKGKDNLPINGFEINQSLSFEQALKGITIWACFAAFDENKRGSIEEGKEATFVVLKKPLIEQMEFNDNYAYYTFIKGKKVYSGEELSY
jgi:predicted amidohydrolase YtcJ